MRAAAPGLPGVVGAPRTRGPVPANVVRPPGLREMAPWIHRPHRAHPSAIETLAPSPRSGSSRIRLASGPGRAAAAVAGFRLRQARAAGMIAGRAGRPLHPLRFPGCRLCAPAMAAALLTA